MTSLKKKQIDVWEISISKNPTYNSFCASTRQIIDPNNQQAPPENSASEPFIITADLLQIHQTPPWSKPKLAVDISAGWTQADQELNAPQKNTESDCRHQGFLMIETAMSSVPMPCQKPTWLADKKAADDAIYSFANQNSQSLLLKNLWVIGLNPLVHLYCLMLWHNTTGSFFIYRHPNCTLPSNASAS